MLILYTVLSGKEMNAIKMKHVIGPPNYQASANSASLPLFGRQYCTLRILFASFRPAGLSPMLEGEEPSWWGDVVEYDYVMLLKQNGQLRSEPR
jgi:hypothetical protein